MNVRLKHEVTFSSVVFDGPVIFPNNFHVEINLITETENTTRQNIAIQRVLFFICDILEGCILIDKDNPNLNKLKKISGGTMIVELPGEPRDQLIGILLYHKLCAITEDNFEIDTLIIGSDRFNNLSYTIDDFGEFGIDGTPWWDREDLTICERKSHPLNKLNWADIDLDWDSGDKVQNNEGNNKVEILEGGPEIGNEPTAI